MALVCALSGQVPEVPILSKSSGCVFEERLIHKYIEENGKDPISGDPLSPEDLIKIKANPVVKPRPPTATSIPSMLKLFQDEWDALMLETYTLRQHLHTTRQELSHALYQHDAACRVIARLTKERDAARVALATLQPRVQVAPAALEQPQAQQNGEPMEVETAAAQEQAGFSEEILARITEVHATLSKARKHRAKPEDLARVEEIKDFKEVATYPGLHSVSSPGILSLALHPKDSNLVLTGGVDKKGVIFNRATEQVVSTLSGHTKKVNSVLFHSSEDVAFTASADSTVRVWKADGQQQHVLRVHQGEVTGITLHPSGNYLISSSLDQSWAFCDITVGKVIDRIRGEEGFTCTRVHPDGIILGTGTVNNLIRIWDVKEQSNVASFEGHTGRITDIAFSENGYYLATASEDSTVKLWDLRRLSNFKTITMEYGFKINSVDFDHSGNYLAFGGSDIRIYSASGKQFEPITSLTGHNQEITSVKFGASARYLASVSMDRNLKVFSL
eukprot:Colp12_sorted_trinity150504_noHs@27156